MSSRAGLQEVESDTRIISPHSPISLSSLLVIIEIRFMIKSGGLIGKCNDRTVIWC